MKLPVESGDKEEYKLEGSGKCHAEAVGGCQAWRIQYSRGKTVDFKTPQEYDSKDIKSKHQPPATLQKSIKWKPRLATGNRKPHELLIDKLGYFLMYEVVWSWSL